MWDRGGNYIIRGWNNFSVRFLLQTFEFNWVLTAPRNRWWRQTCRINQTRGSKVKIIHAKDICKAEVPLEPSSKSSIFSKGGQKVISGSCKNYKKMHFNPKKGHRCIAWATLSARISILKTISKAFHFTAWKAIFFLNTSNLSYILLIWDYFVPASLF